MNPIKAGLLLLALGGAFWAGERKEHRPRVVYVSIGHNDNPNDCAERFARLREKHIVMSRELCRTMGYADVAWSTSRIEDDYGLCVEESAQIVVQ